MQYIGKQQIEELLTPIKLVNKLAEVFRQQTTTPLRQHYDVDNPDSDRETTLLMMPSWQVGGDIGVKLVTVVPNAAKYDLPSIQGIYTLMDAVKGGVKALIDAPTLTAKRTAAASALASQFMSNKQASSLLVIGTGTLAPELVRAHCAVRPISKVTVWGRDQKKAAALVTRLAQDNLLSFGNNSLSFQVASDLATNVPEHDIISCATMSQTPLIRGQWLRAGQHLDMVGAYRPDMREADDECLLRSRIVVDNYAGALKETGDLAIPLKDRVISPSDIEADLFELCREQVRFQRQPQDITFFKSVGHALEDLAAAQLIVSELEAKNGHL